MNSPEATEYTTQITVPPEAAFSPSTGDVPSHMVICSIILAIASLIINGINFYLMYKRNKKY